VTKERPPSPVCCQPGVLRAQQHAAHPRPTRDNGNRPRGRPAAHYVPEGTQSWSICADAALNWIKKNVIQSRRLAAPISSGSATG
jgi:hypothetical protein